MTCSASAPVVLLFNNGDIIRYRTKVHVDKYKYLYFVLEMKSYKTKTNNIAILNMASSCNIFFQIYLLSTYVVFDYLADQMFVVY